jgi:Predicted secreted protein
MKKAISLFLALILCLALGAPALAINEGEARVVLGADLTDSQIGEVYKNLGITRGSVTELTVTNDEERDYLQGLVDDSVIGTKSISCVYIQTMAKGSGLDVTTSNINWCTKEMYESALMTAGVTDAQVKVAAPFSVSGTAALTGIYKAYEDITGTKLSTEAKQAAADELVTTAQLADGTDDAAAVSIVNQLKLILDQTKNMSDAELRDQIISIAAKSGYTLSDEEISQLISLCRSMEKLDVNQLKSRVEDFQKTLKTLSQASESSGKLAQWFKSIMENVGGKLSNLFQNLLSQYKK